MNILTVLKVLFLKLIVGEKLILEMKEINFSSSFPHAVSEIVDKYSSAVNLISCEFSKNRQLADIKNDISKQLSLTPSIAFRQFSFSKAPNESFVNSRRKYSVIVLASDFQDFLEIYYILFSHIYKINGLYLILLTNGEIPEIQNIFNLLWKVQVYDVNVMFEDKNGSILVKTFLPFTKGTCNDTDPVMINEFRDGKFVKDLKDFFPMKIQNLQKCPVNVAISNDSEPYVIVKRLVNGITELTGENIKVINALAQSLNFTIVYTFIGEEGYFHGNGTAKGPLKSLLDSKSDLSINNWWLKINRLKFFDATNFYLLDFVSFVIPSGEELSGFEKLIFPFEAHVWLLTMICFFIGFVVILIVRCHQKLVQFFVFGPIRSPYYNMMVTFVGGAQSVLPKTNFARFLLMVFLLYALVMRTLYQGAFYQLLRSNKHHKELQSIEEMVEKEYTFLSIPGMMDLFLTIDITRKR